MIREVEVKCPDCGEKEQRNLKAFGRNVFVYECDKCKNTYKIEYRRIPVICCKYEYKD